MDRQTIRPPTFWTLAAAALVALVGLRCGGSAAADELEELESVQELRERFNADAGKPRLVLLLSPT